MLATCSTVIWIVRDQPEIQTSVLVLGYRNTDSGVFGKAGFDTATLTVKEELEPSS